MPSAAEELGQILATEAGDPVAILRLPRPELDALDRPTWQVDDATITRQWRKLSRCCHPDKNSTADAARAFQRLSEARDQLLNREQRVVLLQAAAGDMTSSVLNWQTHAQCCHRRRNLAHRSVEVVGREWVSGMAMRTPNSLSRQPGLTHACTSSECAL